MQLGIPADFLQTVRFITRLQVQSSPDSLCRQQEVEAWLLWPCPTRRGIPQAVVDENAKGVGS